MPTGKLWREPASFLEHFHNSQLYTYGSINSHPDISTTAQIKGRLPYGMLSLPFVGFNG